LVDTYYVDPKPPGLLPEGAKLRLPLTLLVCVKSGDFVGAATLSVKVRLASGGAGPKVSTPIKLDGGVHGVNVNIALALPYEKAGLHWVDVEIDGRVATRTPLRIEHRSEPSPAPDVTAEP
jgi:hypothetical protein